MFSINCFGNKSDKYMIISVTIHMTNIKQNGQSTTVNQQSLPQICICRCWVIASGLCLNTLVTWSINRKPAVRLIRGYEQRQNLRIINIDSSMRFILQINGWKKTNFCIDFIHVIFNHKITKKQYLYIQKYTFMIGFCLDNN